MKDNETTGFLAAVASPFFMALGFIIWDKIWMKSGGSAFALNLFKCNLASIGFIIAGLIFGFRINSEEISNEETLKSIGFILLSGFIGIIVGDLAWLEALRLLGASRVIILDSIKPFSAVFFGYLILDERIYWPAYFGIILTVLGILIVSLEGECSITTSSGGNKKDQENQSSSEIDEQEINLRSKDKESVSNSNASINAENYAEDQKLPSVAIKLKTDDDSTLSSAQTSQWNTRKGYFFGILNVFLDTYGFVLTKQHGKSYTTWALNLIRFGSSGILMIALSCVLWLSSRKRSPSSRSQISATVPWYKFPKLSKQSWMKISLGVLFVTFICPALSNYALFQITLSFALALFSIAPLYALFLEWPIHGKEKKPTLRSIGGASLAIAGVIVLSIFNK